MLKQLSETLYKYAKGWLILFFLVCDVIFNTVILPAQQAKIEVSSGGAGPIDLLFFYTPDKVYSMIEAYGQAGRADYRLFELTGDIIYPIVYTLLFSLLLSWLFQRGFPTNSLMRRYNTLPFGAWLFDLLENIGIVSMLSIYPSTPSMLAWLTALFTLIKWLFAGASLVLMLIGLIKAASNRFKVQT